MSSARESKWSPQPPNLQALEKKEAAAMPVMVAAALEMRAGWQQRQRAAGEQQADSGGNSWSGRGGAVASPSCVKPAGERQQDRK